MKRSAWCAFLLSLSAWAQGERPSDADLFGTEETSSALADAGTLEAVAEPAASPASAAADRDLADLTGEGIKSRFDTQESEADPLRIGGTLYLRGQANVSEEQPLKDTSLNAPMLVDLYLDARPNERIRGMVVGRLRYDPLLVQNSFSPVIAGQTTSNLTAALDQLWLKFDIAQRVFITAGRQKAKWGTARIWNPTDFLNPIQRDPLLPFDLRLGINALKIHVPVEKLGWNFYGYGLLDNNGPASTLGKFGGAARAEFVVKQTEFSLSGAWVAGRRPRYAADISSALGPIDVFAEAAFRSGKDFQRWKPATPAQGDFSINSFFEQETLSGIQVQVATGASYTFNYTDNNMLIVGAEYFYNPAGYSDSKLYPWLLFNNQFVFFYTGQHYLAVFASAPGLPQYPWITLSLANLVNLSDGSGTVRFDSFFRVLSYLQVEAFVSGAYGTKGGEFHFGVNVPSFALPDGSTTPAIKIPVPTVSAGLGFRVSI